MAEVIGLVASVIQVASSGFKLSRTLRDYGSAVQGSEKRLKGLDKDIYFTSGIISELATLLKDRRVQSLVSERSIELTREIVAEFEGMFAAIEDIIEGIRADSMGKWKIYFRESKIRLLLSNLDRLKGNLQLLIGVITHASQISTEHPDDAAMVSHRIKILELMVEKEEYTQKYLEEKRKYDTLMVHVNSNSTLGSVSTVQTDTGATSAWANIVLYQEYHAQQDPPSEEQPSGSGGDKGKGTDITSTPKDMKMMKLTAIEEDEGLEAETEKAAENIARLKSELQQLKESVGPTKIPRTVHHPSSSLQPVSHNYAELENTSSITAMEGTSQKAEPVGIINSKPETLAPRMRTTPGPESAQIRKRDVASELGKKAMKGTRYAIGGAAVLITFPISVPLLWWLRLRRLHKQVECSAPVGFASSEESLDHPRHRLGASPPMRSYPPPPPSPGLAMSSVHLAPPAPRMSYLAAELPGPSELGPRAEIGILHELTEWSGPRRDKYYELM